MQWNATTKPPHKFLIFPYIFYKWGHGLMKNLVLADINQNPDLCFYSTCTFFFGRAVSWCQNRKKMVPCPTLLGVLLWVISLFSQGVWSPEGELWRTYAWAVKQDRSVSGKHLHSEFIPKNRVTAKRTYSVRVPETRTKRIEYMKSLPSASWFFLSQNSGCWAVLGPHL